MGKQLWLGPWSPPTSTAKAKQLSVTFGKKEFLALTAMVINCSAEIRGKLERINMVLDAARRFLNAVDIFGENLDATLREGFALTQTLA